MRLISSRISLVLSYTREDDVTAINACLCALFSGHRFGIDALRSLEDFISSVAVLERAIKVPGRGFFRIVGKIAIFHGIDGKEQQFG